MKKCSLVGSFLGSFLLFSCSTNSDKSGNEASEILKIGDIQPSLVIDSLKKLHPSIDVSLMSKGIKQIANLWCAESKLTMSCRQSLC